MRSGVLRVLPAAVLVLAAAGARAGGLVEGQAFCGESAYDHFGERVAGAGDVNGDGCPDVIVGAPTSDYVRVFSGKDGSTLHTFHGRSPGDRFGGDVGGAGDVNDDGFDDLIVGAWAGDYARVFSGKDGKTLHTHEGVQAGDYFGRSVAGLGDLDGDGHADYAVGASVALHSSGTYAPGSVTVYSGQDGSELYTFWGDADLDEFGYSVAAAGDVDADGTPDIVVGAFYAREASGKRPGLVRIFSGADGATLLTVYGSSDQSEFGKAVAGAGDRDADGCDDIVVGSPCEDYGTYQDCGSAAVIGSDGTELAIAYGDSDYCGFGTSVALVGDVGGDGVDDVAVGAPYGFDGADTRTGYVRIFSGADASVLLTLFGAAAQDGFGLDIDAAGDAGGDGRGDILIGAGGDDTAGSEAGAAYIYRTPTPSGTISIDSGAGYTSSASVSLSLTWEAADAAVKDMRLRNAGAAWGEWQSLSTPVAWTLSGTDGTKTVEVQFRDEEDLVSPAIDDTIVLDRTKPQFLSIAVQGGAGWTNGPSVTISMAGSDTGSGLWQVRLRNQGGSFDPWIDTAATVPWTLAPGEGTRTVEAEFRDRAGNVSGLVSDSIGVDQTAPVISAFTLDGGAAATSSRDCQALVTASDAGGSGLALMRFRRSGSTTWEDFASYVSPRDYQLWTGDGVKTVDVQVADTAGNVSATATASILLDQTGPTVSGIVVNGGRPYVASQEAVSVVVTAQDNAGGAGLAEARATYDEGTTFTEWQAWSPGAIVFPRPASSGALPVRIVVRDALGNESGLSPALAVYFVEPAPPFLGTSGSFSGTTSGHDDVDAVALDLVAGDFLSVKMKAAGAEKKAPYPILFDLVRPDGTRLLTGVASISKHLAAATGRHLLVVRLEGGLGPGQGSYVLSVSVKQGAASAKGRTTAAAEVVFEAADGTAFKASLKGDGLDPASVRLTGPDGDVPVAATGGTGGAKLVATLLRGTGTYRLVFTAGGPVAVSWSAKRPKGPALVEP